MANIEDLGISFVHNQVAKMGFFFREQTKHDFGIDAHIETADDNRKGSGRNIAVQIKSGRSYVNGNKKGEIVYHTDERHVRYWAEHSLPVLLIVYSPEQEVAYWCDVKAVISRHPSLLSQEPYKIVFSENQEFNLTSRDALVTLATTPQSALTLGRQHFSIISSDDKSTANAKRHHAKILVGNVNDDVVRIAIYQATKYLRNTVEHSSDRNAEYWKNQLPHLVTLDVYRDLEDKAHTNCIARSIWRDPNSEAAKLVRFGQPNDFTDDIEIYFADRQKQQLWRQFMSERVSTKYHFKKKVERWITISDNLVSKAEALTYERDTQQITEDVYVETMSGLARTYTEQVEHKYDDGTTGPSEVRDAEMRYAATIGSGGNVFIAFSTRGLEIWTDPKRRDYMVKDYLKRYKEDREMLGFELKKIGR